MEPKDISDFKALIQAQGEAWEAFKKANDARIDAKAEGKSVADFEAKMTTINAALDKQADLIRDLETKANRPDFGTDDVAKQLGIECKAFNQARKSFMSPSNVTADLSTEQYTAYKSAHWNWIRRGNMAALTADEQKAMIAGSDPDGGYSLPHATVGSVVKRIYETTPMRSIAAVQSISTFAMEGLYDNDESSYGWVGEVGARTTTTTPQLGKYRIETAEMYADPKASQTLLDDSAIDIEAWLAGKVADKFARVQNAAFVTGTGVGQPRGFSTYTAAATADATRTWGTVEKVVSGANGAFHTTQADPMFTLIQAFKTGYLQNAKWVTTREVIGKIRAFKTSTTAEYIWQPGLQAGTPDSLLGYPVVIAQDLPALSTYATLGSPMWLGNWKEAYQIVDRIGMRTLRDPYTDKPYVHFYTTARVGGGALNFEAFKCLTFTT